MKMIWATRGKTWGFRFLDSGGFDDPLREYESVFLGSNNSEQYFSAEGGVLALRFPDPEGRRDRAGRIIPHDFVLYPKPEYEISNFEEAFDYVWPLVALRFEQVWDAPNPNPLSRA